MSRLDTALSGLFSRLPPAALIRTLPVAVLVALGWLAAWLDRGLEPADWLPFAVLAALVLAVVCFSGAALRPRWPALAGLAGLVGLGIWLAASVSWSPAPALARDEALLVALYAVCFAVPLLTLRNAAERFTATVALVAGTGVLVVATALALRFRDDATDFYIDGRLQFPVTYANAQAAIFLIGFWPALALAARRTSSLASRSLALGTAVGSLAGWLMTQSKGGGVALFLSMIVFFAVSPARLRVLVPSVIAIAIAALGFYPLTSPFRADHGELLDAVHGAGLTTLWLMAAGIVAGWAYAVLDRRIDVSQRARRLAGIVAIVGVLAGIWGGVGAFIAFVDRPDNWMQDKWAEFKQRPERETGVSHFATLGSNRYDFWRVSLNEFREHPVAGIGSRGFQPAYWQQRKSDEIPDRPHSIELELLSEVGLVGFVLFLIALAFPLRLAARGAQRASAAAALAAATYWLAHASVDWTWTFAAAGIPFFVLLGIGASGGTDRLLSRRVATAGAAFAVLLGVLAFAPPWLSSRFTSQALANPTDASADLRWARRLDPLSVEPYRIEAVLAPSSEAEIPPLERAVSKQPRAAELRYLLGLAYLGSGRKADARRELLVARRLAPGEAFVIEALNQAR